MQANSLKESYPWITSDLIKNAVEKATSKRDVKVNSFSLEPALSVGENFSSEMLRCKINYNDGNELRMILKVGMVDPEMQKKTDEIDSFGKESGVYNEIIPKIEKLLEDVGEKSSFSAR